MFLTITIQTRVGPTSSCRSLRRYCKLHQACLALLVPNVRARGKNTQRGGQVKLLSPINLCYLSKAFIFFCSNLSVKSYCLDCKWNQRWKTSKWARLVVPHLAKHRFYCKNAYFISFWLPVSLNLGRKQESHLLFLFRFCCFVIWIQKRPILIWDIRRARESYNWNFQLGWFAYASHCRNSELLWFFFFK